MSLERRKIFMACVALAVAGTGTGVAVATSASTHSAPAKMHAVAGALPQASVLAAVGVFRAPLSVVTDGSSQQELKRLLASAAADGLAAGDADFSLARAAPIAGSSANVWIAPAGNGVCTYLPDPVDGYGAGCATISEVREGNAVSVLLGDLPNGAVMFAAVVADGGPEPRVIHRDGSVSSLVVRSNVAAGLLQPSDKVQTGGAAVDLARFAHRPTKVRAVG
jgi:hypothetical protein